MQNYRKTSHAVYDIKYHLVWSTKYRKKVLYGQIAERLRELIREICKSNEIDIIKGSISRDHVHLFLSVPPFLSVSKLVQSLKGKTSYKLLSEFKELGRAFWGRHIWGRGYFAASRTRQLQGLNSTTSCRISIVRRSGLPTASIWEE
ncbi:MAG: IS200/IS605 family transposase [Syntrophorhabdales bacterium]